MGQSLTSFLAPVGQEKYYVMLMCSLEKHLHFQEKCQEKSGKNIGQDVYEPCNNSEDGKALQTNDLRKKEGLIYNMCSNLVDKRASIFTPGIYSWTLFVCLLSSNLVVLVSYCQTMCFTYSSTPTGTTTSTSLAV